LEELETIKTDFEHWIWFSSLLTVRTNQANQLNVKTVRCCKLKWNILWKTLQSLPWGLHI